MSTNRFRESLASKDEFTITLELVPARGSKGENQKAVLALAEQAAKGGLVQAASLTDSPSGIAALAPDALGVEIARMGLTPLVHFSGKDRNRNQLESLLYAYDRLGLTDLLVMTGDYPQSGFQGKARPVFDLDSVQMLHMVHDMNRGQLPLPGNNSTAHPTDFWAGCVFSPFKRLEAEQMTQYYKLTKKVAQGAAFIITQVGFDVDKFREALLFVRQRFPGIPLLANLFVLNRGAARAMNGGTIPGCAVSDELVGVYEREFESKDKGKGARLERAAKLLAVIRGLGYDGAHIGGPFLKHEDVAFVIERSAELRDSWETLVTDVSFPLPDSYYICRPGTMNKVNRYAQQPPRSTAYAAMGAIHSTAFHKRAPLYALGKKVFESIEGKKWELAAGTFEHAMKFATSRCRECGDCCLAEVAYLCPQSQCPKFQLNGPCGGGRDGYCEVYPGERRCIYVRAYERLKPEYKDSSLATRYVPPRDWALEGTCSWSNYFLGKDHLKGKL